jgi:diguanylate cyclase (GGDEF)-like protein
MPSRIATAGSGRGRLVTRLANALGDCEATEWMLEEVARLELLAAEAHRDPLTGLRNRRAFEKHLSELGKRRVSVVFCDLDYFKLVNDQEGYVAGDEVLQEVARVLSSELRPGEELFRIGGDEFAAVILGGRTAALAVTGRLRAALARRRRGRVLPDLSTGIATAAADASPAVALLSEASADLVKSRHHARGGPTRQVGAALRVLVVDDDEMTRLLLRTTFEAAHLSVDEAGSADEARTVIARQPPDVIVLDVGLPGEDGLAFATNLKSAPANAGIGIVLLTGADLEPGAAQAAGAGALLQKPFSPLDLLDKVERVGGTRAGGARLATAGRGTGGDQLLLYAGDLRRMLEVERRQRGALERAHRETLGALASALEARDSGTGLHSLRVQAYAIAIARIAAPELLNDPSVEYGFLLHDIGKIGIPDQILQKPGPLTAAEWAVMETHAPVGAKILEDVGLLHGEGLSVVCHHHERWDGTGYPGRLSGDQIPLGARVFALADSLDAITSDRPYRGARPWQEAVAELTAQAGAQFDPAIVEAFQEHESELRRIHYQRAAA